VVDDPSRAAADRGEHRQADGLTFEVPAGSVTTALYWDTLDPYQREIEHHFARIEACTRDRIAASERGGYYVSGQGR